ncbi:hypothetical protein VTN02DRAFT_3990 [Thermoascus thermophilus]
MHRRGPIEGPYGQRLTRRVTWRSSTYKLVAYLYVLGVLYIVWLIRDVFFLPFSSSSPPDGIPFTHSPTDDYLARFVGREECGISSKHLYNPPIANGDERELKDAYCQNRASLLDAMSNGGRHGFDAPYIPQGCHYRWYSTSEICEILGRFNGIIFIGDASLGNIYAAFNILLRENLAFGSLKQWEMSKEQIETCRCENQYTNNRCSVFRVSSSDDVHAHDEKSATRSPYACSARVFHTLLTVTGSPAPGSAHRTFRNLISKSAENKKPIPVIHSLSLSTSLSQPIATASMDEWLTAAKASGRKMPFLWVGPTAAGPQKPAGLVMSQGNNALWHYTLDTSKAAQSRNMEALGMYNATLQATSFDGSNYGEKVSLVQAMMIINWLAHL